MQREMEWQMDIFRFMQQVRYADRLTTIPLSHGGSSKWTSSDSCSRCATPAH